MKIYLAAKFSQMQEMQAAAKELESAGHEITASWVFGGEEGLTMGDIALLDLRDIDRADAIVKFSQPFGSANTGGGRHTEFGYALAKGKKTFLIGPLETVFDWHPDVINFPALSILINYLRKKNESVSPTVSFDRGWLGPSVGGTGLVSTGTSQSS